MAPAEKMVATTMSIPIKSPIKSPLGFVSAQFLKTLLPQHRPICAFLPFSAQVEMSLFGAGYDVTLHTNKYVIYEFWGCVKTDPFNIAAQAEALHPKLMPSMIDSARKDWSTYRDPYYRSAYFFLLNHYSETGTLSYGNLKLSNYSPLALATLRGCDERISDLKIVYHNNPDYLSGIEKMSDDEIALISVGNFGGGFLNAQLRTGPEIYDVNHRHLKKVLDESTCHFVLIYKRHRSLLRLYRAYDLIYINKFGQQTSNFDQAEDIIITNLPHGQRQ